MELVLTEKRGGGYQAHRPTCKKIGDREQFDAEELTTEALSAATACSSCKPKDEDMDSMLATTPPENDVPAEVQPPAPQGEPVSEGVDDEDEYDFLGDDEDDLIGVSAADRQVVAPETLTDEEQEELARVEAEQLERDDLLGEPEPEPRKAPKAAPTPKPAKDPELKAEQATALLVKVFSHLDLTVPDPLVFPGFGKAIKTVDRQTVYLNSKGTADVRANSPEQAAGWVEAGLAERRSGNYVRVAVRDL